jgi:hypothetical protein
MRLEESVGLDVYVGALTRYYAGNWETIVQRYGREAGIPVEVARKTPSDAITDVNEVRTLVLSWRTALSEALQSDISRPLDWNETDDAPYFTDKPTWDCYSSLLVWAAHSEHPTLPIPVRFVEDWTTDLAYQRSADKDFKTAFPQLLRDVEMWLPHDFSFTFRAEDPGGNEVGFGSSIELCRQLEKLNRRTWNATEETLGEWRREGAEHKAPVETGAKFAFSLMLELAREAVAHRLIMKLDY